jgi:hypothetical protein
VLALALALPGGAAAAPSCPISYGSADDAKPNKLFLWFPDVAQPTFPEYGGAGFETSPLDPFDVAQIPSYTGTADQLKSRIHDVVVDDYCEFNVKVMPNTATEPPATHPRRAIVGIASDDNSTGRWGRADLVDIGDPTQIGFGRVWGGHYQATGGFPGGVLEGSNSSVQRWANAIGGTAAHEAGHTYGLSHEGTLAPGEDTPLGNHVMPAGSDVNDEQRASARHFSDESFATLAANVGLSIQTMHNWDLVNPNAATGRRLRLTFLSKQASPILSWDYDGSLSPWNNPTVTSNGTQTFKGSTWNRFRLTWQDAKSWSGGSAGQVPGGAEFHVGATFSGIDFNQPDPIIITNSELLDSGGSPLPLKPRIPGYDAGDVSLINGALIWEIFNFVEPGEPMRIRNVLVRQLPRVMSIDAMVPGAGIRDPFGLRFRPYPNVSQHFLPRASVLKGRRDEVRLAIAGLEQRRHILEPVRAGCDVGDSAAGPDSAKCGGGFNVSLFPATTLLITADAVTPDAKVWDRRRKRFVRRDLTTRVHYQLGGRRIDFNKNGVDDAADIAFGQARDSDADGVIDEVDRRNRLSPRR